MIAQENEKRERRRTKERENEGRKRKPPEDITERRNKRIRCSSVYIYIHDTVWATAATKHDSDAGAEII